MMLIKYFWLAIVLMGLLEATSVNETLLKKSDYYPVFNAVLRYIIKHKSKYELFKFLNDKAFRQHLMSEYKKLILRKYFKNRI